MDIISLLNKIKTLGFSLSISNDNIIISSEKGNKIIDPQIISYIKDNKKRIIEFLKISYEYKISVNLFSNKEKRDYYTPTSIQERFYNLQKYDIHSTSYNLPFALRIVGELDYSLLSESLNKTINQNDVLKGFFFECDEKSYFKILDTVDYTLKVSQLNNQEIKKVIDNFIEPINLNKWPLFRFEIFNINRNENLFLCDFHHSIMDGFSLNIFVKQVIGFYQKIFYPINKIQYRDILVTQSDDRYQTLIENNRNYWEQRYSGELPILDIPLDYNRPKVKDNIGKKIKFELNETDFLLLKEAMKVTETTLNMILIACYNILLYKYTNQEDIIIGIVSSGRERKDVKDIIGLMIETIPLRNFPNPNKSLGVFINEVRQCIIDSFDNQPYPFENIIKLNSKQRDFSRNPIFDTMLIVQNLDIKKSFVEDLEFIEVELEKNSSKLDITIEAIPKYNKLLFTIEYRTSLFKQKTIERFIKNYINLINEISTVARDKSILNKSISEFNYINDIEKHNILYYFNNTLEAESPNCYIDLFLKSSEINKNNIAIDYCNSHLTYEQLNERSDKIASILVNTYNIKSGDFVGVMLNPGPEMIAVILGIFKIGSIFLPLNIEFPDTRINEIAEDCSLTLMIVERFIEHKGFYSVAFLESILDEIETSNKNSNYYTPLLNDPAYLYYTSGSTGKPKGILISYGSFVDYTLTFMDYFKLNSKDIIIQQSINTFDTFIEEVFPILLCGGKILILPDGAKDIDKLIYSIVKKNANILSSSPLVINEINKVKSVNFKLKALISGGDILKKGYIDSLIKHNTIYNTYGPTETTVCATFNKITTTTDSENIGKPIRNKKVIILDSNNNICPIGIRGEICIGGRGNAIGYINQPEQTAKSFINNPFGKDEIIYKTGDMGRWNEDGSIKYLGRKDSQIKLRGIRIELKEIENAIISIKNINDAIVMTYGEDENVFICAYFVGEKGLQIEDIRNELIKMLPYYLVPLYIIQIDRIPLNRNNKIDYTKLKKPELNKIVNFQKPTNQTEIDIIDCWADILGIEQKSISINSSFLDLGGHSLKATRLIQSIQKRLGVKLTIRDFFTNTTVYSQAKLVREKKSSERNTIYAIEKKEFYDVSQSQKRIWVLSQLDGASSAYHINGVYRIQSFIDIKKLEMAFMTLIERHESLRTVFLNIEGEPYQRIVPYSDKNKSLTIIKLKKNNIKNVEEVLLKDLNSEFDLENGPLYRFNLYIINNNQYFLIFNIHHIISDGWSIDILLDELMILYTSTFKKGNINLPKLSVQYKDYTIWNNHLINEDNIKIKEFWKSRFSKIIPSQGLFTDNSRKINQTFSGESINFSIDSNVFLQFKTFCNNNDISLFVGLISIVNVLLFKLTAQKDIIIGTPIAGRDIINLENIVGFFVNTLPIKTTIDELDTFVKTSIRIKEEILLCFENQLYGMGNIIEDLKLPRTINRNPLFDIMVSMQNTESGYKKNTDISNFNISKYAIQKVVSKFDITFNFREKNNNLCAEIEYNNDLYNQHTINNITNIFRYILNQVLEISDISICNICISPPNEQFRILNEFNKCDYDFNLKESIYDIFVDKVNKYPDRDVLLYNEKSLTFNELKCKVDKLSNTLVCKGVKSGSVVAIISERSFEMIIGILAILRAGGTYVPIDDNFPEKRKRIIAQDCDSKILLYNTKGNNNYSYFEQLIDINSKENYNTEIDLNNNSYKLNKNAYILYTSGSTGNPKGVMVFKKSIINLLYQLNKLYAFNEDDIYLFKTPFIFDVSVSEMYCWLFGHGKLTILPDGEEKEPIKIFETIESFKITHINFVPSMFKIFSEYLEEFHICNINSLRYVFLAGEALNKSHIEKFNLLYSKVNIENLYGPTESTVYSSKYSYNKYTKDNIPIGNPIINYQIYILNKNLQSMPVGFPGELYISGLGVSVGYINNPELTNQFFIKDPFNEDRIMYSSRDLARWLPDGNIEFLGRIDKQVKIRGNRIELEEIENCILRIKDVKNAIVNVIGELENQQLCAYYIADEELNIGFMKNEMESYLPNYMIPSYFIYLKEINYTSSGKVDKTKLPLPNIRFNFDKELCKSNTEKKLLSLWSQVLNIFENQIEVDVDFFDIGGHSLRATILSAKILKHFNIKISLSQLFQHNTIRTQAKFIDSNIKEKYISINPVEKRDFYKLSAAQERLFFLYQLDKISLVYNMPMVYKLTNKVSKDKLTQIITTLVQRHESLRTGFVMVNEYPFQKVYENVKIEIEEIHIDNFPENKSSVLKPFDLSNPPLIRIAIINNKINEKYLLIDVHHILIDGYSQYILLNEFDNLLKGNSLNSRLKFQYKDFSLWSKINEGSDLFLKQKEFWIKQYKDEIPIINLPYDFKRNSFKDFKGANVNFIVSTKVTLQLQRICKENEITLYMLIYGCFILFLSKICRQKDIVIGTPVAMRNHSDYEKIVGLFVNTLPIRTIIKKNQSLKEFFKEIRSNVLLAFENQNFQFESLVEEVTKERDPSRNPIFDVMFNLLNQNKYGDDFTGNLNKHIESTSKFDLNLLCIELKDQLLFNLEYSTSLFYPSTINVLIKGFCNVVNEVCNNFSVTIDEVNLLKGHDYDEIIQFGKGKEIKYSDETNLISLFKRQVIKNPDKIALIFNNSQVSYKCLDQTSDLIASQLVNIGVYRNELIGLIFDRSIELIITLIGIIKAGCGCLPIDFTLPENRINSILNDSKARIILSNLKDKLSITIKNKYKLINVNKIIRQTNIDSLFLYHIQSNDILYVLYTSGSTGRPKGVMLMHNNFTNLMLNNRYTGIDFSNVMQFASISFDVSFQEIFSTLLDGGRLHLLDEDERKDIIQLLAKIEKESISTLFLPTAFTKILFNEKHDNFKYPNCISHIVTAGEQLIVSKRFNDYLKANKITLHNHYGPTETHVVTTRTFKIDEAVSEIPDIGYPVINTNIYIFDQDMNPLPKGIPGELCIGGVQVGKGYLGNSELQSMKFIKNPKNKNEIIYCTGDLAKWNNNGSIIFLGRIDQQLKIRGYRVEPEEIEKILIEYQKFSDVKVLAAEDTNGNSVLCAYFVPMNGAKDFSIDEIKKYLLNILPEYMVPAVFIPLERMPLNTNGKVDKKVLPKPSIKVDFEHLNPESIIESKLLKLWSEVLRIPLSSISTKSNYFEIGGHSLTASILSLRISKFFKISFPLKAIFQYPNIKQQAKYIESIKQNDYKDINPIEKKEYYPLSSAQTRYFISQNMFKDEIAYNNIMFFYIEGDIVINKISLIFKQLIQSIEILRTSFYVDKNILYQKVNDNTDFQISKLKYNSFQDLEQFIKPFDLKEKNLLRVALFVNEKQENILAIDIHSIISDGISLNILVNKFVKLLNEQKLEPERLHYKDYSTWENIRRETSDYLTQKEFWLKMHQDYVNNSYLPYDLNLNEQKSTTGGSELFSIDEETLLNIQKRFVNDDITLFNVLIAVYFILVNKITAENNVIIGVPVSGRQHADFESTIGYFANVLAIKQNIDPHVNISSFLSSVSQNIQLCMSKQEYSFDLLVSDLNIKPQSVRNPIFDVMFVFHNMYNGIEEINNPKIRIKPLKVEKNKTKMDWHLSAIVKDKRVYFEWTYSSQLFARESICLYISYYKNIIESILNNPENSISKIQLNDNNKNIELIVENFDYKF